MRIVPRITIFFVGAMTIALAWRGIVQIDRDEALFESDMRRDHRVVGDVLKTSLADVLVEDDEERAVALVALANASKDGPRFTWFHGPGAASQVPDDVAMEPQRVVAGPDAEELVTWLPVREGDPSFGVLEIRESLIERDRYIRSDVRYTVLGILAGVGLACGLAFALSKIFVGRPIDALVTRARRIGEGNLEATEIEGPEELRTLSTELNAMCARLSRARERVTTETEARIHALDELRHADRLATVGKLAAGIAHELGTPLAVVGGHAQMIAEGEVRGEAVTKSARVIEQQVQRSSRIIRQLLDFARRRGPDGSTSDVLLVATEATAVLGPMANKRGIELVVRGESADAAIAPERLQQIVTNLVINAIDASPSGSAIELDVSTGDGWIKIDVRDGGSGIPDDVLPRIFEPFFTTKGTGEGTGLGLSVVHGIVRDHGGFIDVKSDPKTGSTFSVHLQPGPRA